MKRVICSLLFLLLSQLMIAQNFTREDAIKKAIFEIIVPPNLDHPVTAFITKLPLQPGDIVKPFLDGKEKVISRPTWFVWINDNPESFFAHKTRYLFINAESGQHEVSIEEWWPELNGESLFMSDEERLDLNLIIYSDLHRSKIDK